MWKIKLKSGIVETFEGEYFEALEFADELAVKYNSKIDQFYKLRGV